MSDNTPKQNDDAVELPEGELDGVAGGAGPNHMRTNSKGDTYANANVNEY